jgi:hypothetical protein
MIEITHQARLISDACALGRQHFEPGERRVGRASATRHGMRSRRNGRFDAARREYFALLCHGLRSWVREGQDEDHVQLVGILRARATLAYAEGTDTSVLKLPQDIEFKGPLTGAPQTAVLYGDPTKPGVFVTRVKFSAGWKDMPHWHPEEVRTVAVLSGTFYFASGEKWDETKFKAYPAGTFYSEPSKAPHYTWAKDGEVIIQVTGVGPSGKTFIPQ